MTEVLKEVPKDWRNKISPASDKLFDWIEKKGLKGNPESLRTCVLCGAQPQIIGMLELGESSQLYGAAKGKNRICLYSLCDACMDLPNVANRVEAKILTPIN